MAKETAWMVGPEKVVSWYESMTDITKSACYSVWQGKDLRFTYDSDSVSDGADLLLDNLMMVKEMGNSVVMKIRLHKNMNGIINDRTPYNASVDFRCVHVEEDSLAWANLHQMGSIKAIGDLRAEIKALKEKNDEPKGIMGYLQPFLENDQVQTAIAGTLIGLVNKVLKINEVAAPTAAGPAAGPAVMNGIDDAGELEGIERDLRRLEKHDPQILEDIGRLANLSEKNPQLFKALVGQLRTL